MRETAPPRMFFCPLSARKGMYVWRFERERPPLGQTVFHRVDGDAGGNSLWCTRDHEGPCCWPEDYPEGPRVQG